MIVDFVDRIRCSGLLRSVNRGRKKLMQRVSRFLKLAPCCIVVAIVIVADAVLGQSLSERRINPGHAGAWLNPETSGQGFLLDVLPETDMAFLAWFTYDCPTRRKLPRWAIPAIVG
jgi:hypothetical protein